ncbi:MAG: indolepyruvate ferredoxin oxidoreductase subunit alpha [Clostridiaceae bacterium]|nr:indolepyruvate ferredoxin oxidoreductase subunit alpha [Clostridiaceae bacterium]
MIVLKEILLGNMAIALGAVHAGVKVVSGYPGTPSTEVLESVVQYNRDGRIQVEWSTNEKAALEIAAGASYCGARSMVTMKQVGLNVASDPLMSLGVIGTKGGMVVVVADDPGPISSQTEQDTRHFGKFANIPVLDPSSPEEAYEMAKYAFELSEKLKLPVILRPTTKVCHSSGTVETGGSIYEYEPEGFVKDPRWVIFPPLSYRRHLEIEKQQNEISELFDSLPFNRIEGEGEYGIAAGGVTYAIVKDIVEAFGLKVTLLKSGAVFPPPNGLYEEFLNRVQRVLVLEELDPVIEEQLYQVMAIRNLQRPISGKMNGFVTPAGELKFDNTLKIIEKFLGVEMSDTAVTPPMELPMRAPVLCAGCPHRASFYAVKKAMHGKKAVFCGDIGCYTLGNGKPLEMTDTCLCMGAGITIAQGIKKAEPDTYAFAFIGDSTFFASGMTGLANAVYNQTDINVIILDNSTTAMTGHQPHPGTGRTMMGTMTQKIDIYSVAKALNVGFVERLNPFDQEKSIETVKKAAEYEGVSVLIFEAPCITLIRPQTTFRIQNCTGCRKCLREIGCPAMSVRDNRVEINDALCYGCGLCVKVCPTGCIQQEVQS